MNQSSGSQFNVEKIFELIDTHIKSVGIIEFCKKAGISTSVLYGWRKKDRHKGPSPKSLNKIVDTFRSLGVNVSPNYFYEIPIEESNKLSEDIVCYGKKPFSYDTESKLIEQLRKANDLLHEKNQLINNQFKEILALKIEVEELKSKQ